MFTVTTITRSCECGQALHNRVDNVSAAAVATVSDADCVMPLNVRRGSEKHQPLSVC